MADPGALLPIERLIEWQEPRVTEQGSDSIILADQWNAERRWAAGRVDGLCDIGGPILSYVLGERSLP